MSRPGPRSISKLTHAQAADLLKAMPEEPKWGGLTRAETIRVAALELAIRAAPHLIPTNLDRVTGAQLTAEAEKIEQWLKDAK